MKKYIMIGVFLLCAVLMLAGCGAQTDGTSSAQASTQPPQGSFELRSPDGQVQFSVGDLKSAQVYEPGDSDDAAGYAILATLTDQATVRFAEYTGAHIGETLALYIDGEEISAPIIHGAITDGQVLIHGDFQTEQAAQVLVDAILGVNKADAEG